MTVSFQSEWLDWEPETPRVGTDRTARRASVSSVSSLNGRSEENQSLPLPPEGDPRRCPIELIDAVWAAGCWLVIEGSTVHAVPRDDTTASLGPELVASVKEHQAGLLRVLQRRPR